MMSLRHALLALLEAAPMSGYTLLKHFDQSAAYVWHAPHSQIYPELRRMEADGLIVGRVEPRGAHATRRTYSITSAGRKELERWVEEPTPTQPERDIAHLKATYFEFGSFENARNQFRTHMLRHEQLKHKWEAHVEALQNRSTALLKLRLSGAPPRMHEPIIEYKVHVYKGLVQRAKDEVAWARAGLELVDHLEATAGVASAASPAQAVQ
jgi:PadR family transcriptional regulator, regulator of vanillate utilization